MQNWFLFKDKPVNSAILRRILHVELKKKLKFLMKVKQPQLEKPACNFFLCYLLTFWNMDQAKWFDPHSFDFMDWKLVNDGDHELHNKLNYYIRREIRPYIMKWRPVSNDDWPQ